MSRIYKINTASTTAYMKAKHMANTAIVGETADKFLLQNGEKMSSLPKGAVEDWALDNGYVRGMGVDALPERDRIAYEANKEQNTMRQKERASKEYGARDDVIEGYHSQKKETRLARSKAAADVDAPKPQAWKGNMSYPKGTKGTKKY